MIASELSALESSERGLKRTKGPDRASTLPHITDTDVSVFFADWNVLHKGDTWFHCFYPFIDYNSGGSTAGMIVASAEKLDLCDNQAIVAPGHGSPGTRQDLAEFRQMLLATHGVVHDLKHSGRSLQEVTAARPTLPSMRCGVLALPREISSRA